jgi:hypothetical protein
MRLGYSYPNKNLRVLKKFLLFIGIEVNESEIAAAVIFVIQHITGNH